MLLDHLGAERLGDLLEHAPQAERRLLELEPVGLDLREVEQVVEDPEQVPRRGVRHARRSRGPSRGRSDSSARPSMLRIAFIGVRISWLIVARNALFARFAASAASFAATSSASSRLYSVMSCVTPHMSVGFPSGAAHHPPRCPDPDHAAVDGPQVGVGGIVRRGRSPSTAAWKFRPVSSAQETPAAASPAFDVLEPLLRHAVAVVGARGVAEHGGGAGRGVVPARAVERHVPVARARQLERRVGLEVRELELLGAPLQLRPRPRGAR